MIGFSLFLQVEGSVYHIGWLKTSFIISPFDVAKIHLMNSIKHERILRKLEWQIRIEQADMHRCIGCRSEISPRYPFFK